MQFSVTNYFSRVCEVIHRVNEEEVQFACELITRTIGAEKKVITCGNGGSANAASHYITDWNKMYNLRHGRLFKGVSLCDNVGLITAFGNDTGYENIFSGQLRALGEKDDLLIVVSGSGNSPNVVSAINTARELGLTSLAFVGYDGGTCGQLADYKVHIPSYDMQFCEDIHLMLGHIVMKSICDGEIYD